VLISFQQAQAVGRSFSSTKFTRIYASDLLRAHATGKAVHDHHAEPKPPFIATKLLREQHFGVAEGKEWAIDIPEGTTREELEKKGIYPVYWERDGKFDDGESLDDLFCRAEDALKECVFPYLDTDGHIAIASHGLCISELMSVLVKLDPEADHAESYRGLLNTAWTRVELKRRVSH
jgi:broad specificity phosphatase PhoE